MLQGGLTDYRAGGTRIQQTLLLLLLERLDQQLQPQSKIPQQQLGSRQ
jgi:hypothetical protein